MTRYREGGKNKIDLGHKQTVVTSSGQYICIEFGELKEHEEEKVKTKFIK